MYPAPPTCAQRTRTGQQRTASETVPSSTRLPKYQVGRDCQRASSSPSPEPCAYYGRVEYTGQKQELLLVRAEAEPVQKALRPFLLECGLSSLLERLYTPWPLEPGVLFAWHSFRSLWTHRRSDIPKEKRRKGESRPFYRETEYRERKCSAHRLVCFFFLLL